MNLVKYIYSGVIEDYYLGVLSPFEMQKVRQLASMHPQIGYAIAFAESVLIKYAEDLDLNSTMDTRSEGILFRILQKINEL